MKKSDIHLDHTEQGSIELLIYTAILILKYELSYSRRTRISNVELC